MSKDTYVRTTRSVQRCTPLGVHPPNVEHKTVWVLSHPYKEGLIAIIVYYNCHFLRCPLRSESCDRTVSVLH